jgi:rhamnosyltransferase
MDELFIDYVDIEYCLRLQERGFRIVQVGTANLLQALGNLVPKRLFFWRVASTNHPPIRAYYRFRNRLIVISEYFTRFPAWSTKELMLTGNELVKILLFEYERMEKLKMAFMGMAHFFARKHGKLRDH